MTRIHTADVEWTVRFTGPIRNKEDAKILIPRRYSNMGMMDAFTAEDRVQVKVSSLYQMLKEGTKAEVLINAVKCEVPYEYIMQMATGKSGELQAYKDTGLTPDKIRDIDAEYTKLCKQVKELKAENKNLLLSLEQHQNASEVDSTANAASEVTNDSQEHSGNPQEEPEDNKGGGDARGERKKIDIGKIMALKKAGWKVKDIADEMHIEPSAVSNAIWRYNKQNENS